MKFKLTLLFLAFTFCQYCLAQDVVTYKSWNPVGDETSYIGGQAWQDELQSPYDRFPARAEKQVRSAVWNLSKNSAGLAVNFRTDATEIIVKYAVSGQLAMPHMPATGVSGVDLYAKDENGEWIWSGGKYSFGDTITYRFVNLDPSKAGREYTLYLPLYNTVKWMNISVPVDHSFVPSLPSKEKPIVVYGTSIAQGGCATRPGLAWTNILGRRLEHPLLNLAFSGNGKLEPEVLGLVAEKEARVYVLDCLPNLTDLPIAEFKKRVNDAVGLLKKKQPAVPILLTEHDGYTDEGISLVRKESYQKLNRALKEVYDSLSSEGIQGIHLLSKEDINQDIESMVDGVHPNDIGMMNYANAYEKKLREILNEPKGEISTTVPVTQYRDAPLYYWNERQLEMLDYSRANQSKVVFFGNSIVHFWGGNPIGSPRNGEDSWPRYFNQSVVNMGMGWDRIENVLWRVYHGALDGIKPEHVVVMIGTNNLGLNSNEEIAEGIRFLLKGIIARQSTAKILLVGVLPRRGMEERVVRLNQHYERVARELKIQYVDAGNLFLAQDNKIDESLFSDGLHPNNEGYERLGKVLHATIEP